MLEMTLLRLQTNSAFSHCWPSDFTLQLFALWVFSPFIPCADEGRWFGTCRGASDPWQYAVPHERLRFPGPSSAGVHQHSSSGSVVQVCAKGDHERCGLLNCMLLFIISSLICIFKCQKGVSVSFHVFCAVFVDHLDADNCRRNPAKKLSFCFSFLRLRQEGSPGGGPSKSFSTGLFWLETFPRSGYSLGVVTEIQLALKQPTVPISVIGTKSLCEVNHKQMDSRAMLLYKG